MQTLIFHLIISIIVLFLGAQKQQDKNYNSGFEDLYKKSSNLFFANPDSCLVLAQYALKTAKKENDKKNIASALLLIGKSNNKLNNTKQAIIDLKASEEIYFELNMQDSIAQIINIYGEIAENSGDYDEAIKQYNKKLNIHKNLNDKIGVANTLNKLGVAYKYKAKYSQALEYHYASLHISEEIGYVIGKANALGNIANVNEAMKNYKKAIELYTQILSIYQKLNNEDKIANTFMNIGVVYYYTNEYDKALKNFSKSLEISERLGNELMEAYLLNNIACTYQVLKKYKETLKFFEKALRVSEKIDNKWNIANTLNNLAATQIELGNLNDALIKSNKALSIAKDIKASDIILESYKLLSDIYNKNKNYEEALSYFKLYKEANDTLFNETNQRQIAEMNAKYESQLKEKEIQALQIKEQQRIIVFVSITVILFMIIAVTSYVRFRQRRRDVNFLKSVIESLTHPFCVYNVDTHKIEMANKTAENPSSPYFKYLDGHDSDKTSPGFTPNTTEEVLKNKTMISIEFPIELNKEETKYYEFYGFPILDNKKNVTKIIEYAVDITEKKVAMQKIKSAFEREKELNDLKSQFISSTSHEFRTPLATLFSSVELIQHYDKTNSESKKLYHIARIKSVVKYMARMLDDILTINKAEANMLEFEPEKFNLRSFCGEIIEDVLVYASSNHYINQIFEGKTNSVFLDTKLLRHILSNLLSNAIKYSPHGGQIIFKTEILEDEVVFLIRDEGIGIPKENQKNLFQHFFRAKNVGSISGAGLGLAIVKKAVEAHNGKIEFESEINRGTKFIIKLPLPKNTQP